MLSKNCAPWRDAQNQLNPSSEYAEQMELLNSIVNDNSA